MISVIIHKTNDLFDGFVVKGHSEYGESGTDIVCAAVSILSYTALNSMSLVAGISDNDIDYDVEDDTGFLKVNTRKNNEKTDVIYRNFLVGIKLLLEDYNNYITLNYEEV